MTESWKPEFKFIDAFCTVEAGGKTAKLNLNRIVLRKYFENCPDLDYNLYPTILEFSQNITELFFLKTAVNPKSFLISI